MEGQEKLPLRERFVNAFHTDELFHETELQANRLGAYILLWSGVLLVLIAVLTVLGVFPLTPTTVLVPAIIGIVEIFILLAVCSIVRCDAWWLEYLLMVGMVLVYAQLDSMLTHKAAILMVLPVVFSSRYFSRRLTVFTALFTGVAFLISSAWGATHGMINLNIVTMDAGTEIIATGGFLGRAVRNAGVSDEMLTHNTLLYDYVPKLLMFTIAAIISGNIARCGREMVLRQHEEDIKKSRIEADLKIAASIQNSMLPDSGPELSDRRFDISAEMDPAREVGGDFYDFFYIDDDHLCMVIADVSGKGVSAALFMMVAMIVLSGFARTGKSPGDVLADTNAAILKRNSEDMFLSVWVGVLELSTGKLTAANAGHEYPAVKHADGGFELLRDRHGLVLGAMEGMKYHEYELSLEPGSKVFVYTDGVPEAMNGADELFGTDRMIDALNADPDAAPETVLRNVHRAVDGFVEDAEQFDDLTMLCVEYKGPGQADELEVEATIDRLDDVQEFVSRRLESVSCSDTTRMHLALAVEEVFVNIASYAYSPETGPATVRVEVSEEPLAAIVSFIDRGVPYDPLAKDDPDITLAASDRQIGGLGVFLTKRLMDDVRYEYRDGQNILTIRKELD